MRAVDSGADLFGDEDEEGGDSKRRVKRELGAEGDLDELDYEEDFADDEEKPEPDADDEEAKELEVRMTHTQVSIPLTVYVLRTRRNGSNGSTRMLTRRARVILTKVRKKTKAMSFRALARTCAS